MTEADEKKFEKDTKELKEKDKELWKTKDHFYRLTIENKGGLVGPVLIEITDIDGKKERHNLPAEIWKKNAKQVHKLLITKKQLAKVTIDPERASPESDFNNNTWPREIQTKPFTLKPREKKDNHMQDALKKKKEAEQE